MAADGASPIQQEIRAPELVPPLGPYSDAVRHDGLLYVSGCVPLDQDGKLVGEGDFIAQARQAFENLGHVLRAGGADFANVLKLTIYLTDIADRPHMTPVRHEFLGETRPASTLVEVSALAVPGIKVEVEAIAAVPNG
jgi:2-iminobutanoate/2-iminopropanoate deaminase